MWTKYTWLDKRDAFCCRFSVFRDFAKTKKTFSTSPGLPYRYAPTQNRLESWQNILTDNGLKINMAKTEHLSTSKGWVGQIILSGILPVFGNRIQGYRNSKRMAVNSLLGGAISVVFRD